MAKLKNAAAVALGRLGGKAKGKPKGLAAMSEEKRKEIAAQGLKTRRANAKRAARKAGAK